MKNKMKRRKAAGHREDLPAVIAPEKAAPVIKTGHGVFDLDDPSLPNWVDERAFRSGGYPYADHLPHEQYDEELEQLQIELVKLQKHVGKEGRRMVILFEGRDAAGKGGSIFVFRQYLNPRQARTVALPAPTEVERGQWYFQRYVAHLPTAGEMVLFDRSWYNRAGVEPVMGFCSKAEHKVFLRTVPGFERMLVDHGITLYKFWVDIGRAMQLKRFHERRHNPLKVWKLSPIDYAALERYDDYTAARDEMFAATDKSPTPWTVVLGNDKRRAHLSIIRHVLSTIDYAGKDESAVRQPDDLILGGPGLMDRK